MLHFRFQHGVHVITELSVCQGLTLWAEEKKAHSKLETALQCLQNMSN